MEIDDRVVIQTPEGVELELALAGVGSRFAAAIIDWLVQTAILIALYVVLVQLGNLGAAVLAIVSFVLLFGYDVGFEVLAAGRTPGKRVNGLRVVREGGEPVTFTTSAIRNLIRIVDLIPGIYLVGAISVIVSSKNQRLGDLAASTLVIRDPKRRRQDWSAPPSSQSKPASEALASWDASAIGSEELAAVRKFLDRREELTTDARAELASTLATPLRARVTGAPAALPAETFLELLNAVKGARG